MDIKTETKKVEGDLEVKLPKFSEMDAKKKGYLIGIALSGRIIALADHDISNPFPNNSVESEAFRVGFASVEKNATVPSQLELCWISSELIEQAFRPITDGKVSVTRHTSDTIVFIANGVDIERIFALCQKVYSVRMSKSLSSLKSNVATLTLYL